MPTCKEYHNPNGRPDKSGTITYMIPANCLAEFGMWQGDEV